MVWIDIFKGLLTPIIACVVAFIAYQQHKTSRDRLRLELYDKRFKVYRGLIDLLGYIVTRGDVTDAVSRITEGSIKISRRGKK